MSPSWTTADATGATSRPFPSLAWARTVTLSANLAPLLVSDRERVATFWAMKQEGKICQGLLGRLPHACMTCLAAMSGLLQPSCDPEEGQACHTRAGEAGRGKGLGCPTSHGAPECTDFEPALRLGFLLCPLLLKLLWVRLAVKSSLL